MRNKSGSTLARECGACGAKEDLRNALSVLRGAGSGGHRPSIAIRTGLDAARIGRAHWRETCAGARHYGCRAAVVCVAVRGAGVSCRCSIQVRTIGAQ